MPPPTMPTRHSRSLAVHAEIMLPRGLPAKTRDTSRVRAVLRPGTELAASAAEATRSAGLDYANKPLCAESDLSPLGRASLAIKTSVETSRKQTPLGPPRATSKRP